ncbi:MAG: hypothetical protein DME19_19585 [Verrucomicrobia bacterium]|nr:MAG: hypothetical protein DME19_19585 [Verrucomicrobiota bacterium]
MNSKTPKMSLQPLKCALTVLLGGLLVAAFAADIPEPARPAADNQEARDELQKIRDGISQLREENAKLKEENAQLRKENQQLRRLLAEKDEGNVTLTPTTNSVSGVQTNQGGAETEIQLTHWFTTSSGKRHNSRCRYFKTTEGRLCGPEEGKACKLCGG